MVRPVSSHVSDAGRVRAHYKCASADPLHAGGRFNRKNFLLSGASFSFFCFRKGGCIHLTQAWPAMPMLPNKIQLPAMIVNAV